MNEADGGFRKTDDWTFGGTWPFEPRWFDTPYGKIHYVDVGPRDGHVVVMVHGNPTWGYLWRRFIHALADAGYRCIVPDHLGFGRSDKPFFAAHYRFLKHCTRFESLIESLDIPSLSLIVQDWGGPIASYWASKYPDKLENLIVLNTLMHPVREELRLHGYLKMIRTPIIGEYLVLVRNATIEEFLFKRALVHPERFDETVKAAYRKPFIHWYQRKAVLEFPRAIATKPTDAVSQTLAETHKVIHRLSPEHVLIVWPMKDMGFTPAILDEYWKKDFPDAEIHTIEESGHYIQEDAHEKVIPLTLQFLKKRSMSPELSGAPSTARAEARSGS